MDPVAHVQWSLSDRVLPVVGSVRVIVYMSCGPRSFMQDAAMVVESSLARSCNHLQPKYGCAHMVFSLRASSPFVFTLDGSWLCIGAAGCQSAHWSWHYSSIWTILDALLRHVTWIDTGAIWGYWDWMAAPKPGKERETDWPWLIDAWNGQLQADVVLKCSQSKGNSTECGEDIYTKRFRLSIASQASKSWIESH